VTAPKRVLLPVMFDLRAIAPTVIPEIAAPLIVTLPLMLPGLFGGWFCALAKTLALEASSKQPSALSVEEIIASAPFTH
jgi:hypothetical protein